MTERIKSGMDDLAAGRVQPMTDFSKLSDAEINRKVAEALGWTHTEVSQYGFCHGVPPKSSIDNYVFRDKPHTPYFTTDAAAYMGLVEEIKRSGCTICIVTFIDGVWGLSAALPRENTDERVVGFQANNTFLGRAVCECYLKWKETEGKQ